MLVDNVPRKLDSVFPAVFSTDYTIERKVLKPDESMCNDLIQQNEYSMVCLNNIQSQIEEIKNKKLKDKRDSNEMIYEDISQSSDEGPPSAQQNLEQLINSDYQNLEANLNKTLNR